MKRKSFSLVWCLVAILLSTPCSKSKKMEQTAVAPAESRLFSIDGNLQDWETRLPLWKEGGAEGRGTFETNIDVKKVYITNDSHFLFVFLQCSPSVVERFKLSPSGGVIGDLYLDTDNNPQTGSGPVATFNGEKFSGYELRAWIPIGVLTSQGQSEPYVACEIRPFTGDDFSAFGIYRTESGAEASNIAHGPDGVEIALPLDSLGIKTPATIRILLAENSHLFQEDGYSMDSLNLE